MTKFTFKGFLPHLIGISAFILVEVVVLFFHNSNASFWEFAVYYFVDIILFYLSAYFYIRIAQKDFPKIDFRFISLSLLWITLFTFFNAVLTYLLYSNSGLALTFQDIKVPTIKALFRYYYLYLLAYGLWSANSRVKRERENREKDVALLRAENENAQLEIALLRSQITPHLMLNTLNGVHNLVMTSNPRASVLVELLMDNLRLSLKGSDPNQRTTLGDEIQLVKNIVHLYEQLGKRNCKLNISLDQNILKVEFPVNLIATLVENVFKHGDLNKPDHPATIEISYDFGSLDVAISNRYKAFAKDEKLGIGIENIQRRLDMQFKGLFELRIDKTEDTYYTKLNIKL